MIENILNIVLTIIVSYLLGSISFSLVLSKLIHKDDIRKYGSKNAGATNMLRTYGWKLALFTVLGDMLKGIAAVVVGNLLIGNNFGGYIAGLACILGHMFPIFFKFKGGKGVATGAAIVLSVNPTAFFIVFTAFVLCVVITKYVSLGSCVGATAFPLLTIMNCPNNIVTITCAIVIASLIIWRHRGNIKRIVNQTESKITFKK